MKALNLLLPVKHQFNQQASHVPASAGRRRTRILSGIALSIESLALVATGLALLAGLPLAVQAATVLKANNTDNLNLTTSWVGSTVPGTGDVGKWDSTVTVANAVVLGSDASWRGLAIANPGGIVTIGSGNTLTLGGSGIDMS